MVLQTKSTIIIFLLLFVGLISCNRGKTTLPVVSLNPELIPDMRTENVSALISDSGITRYRMEAEIWDVFSDGKGNKWYFPNGIYVEQFDSLFRMEASVEADTAYYYQTTGLWHLIRNVRIVNLEQKEFKTSELFWDERKQIVYSDSLVRVQDGNNVIYAIGFQSKQDLSRPVFYKIQPSVLSVEEKSEPDSTIVR